MEKKNILRGLASLLVVFFLLSLLTTVSAYSLATDKSDFRGLWVATVCNMDYPSKPSTDMEILKSEALSVLDYAENTGFNAVFLQVRPTEDAFYKSNYFPWSKYLTGKQGVAPDNDFDPLSFWVDEAHKRGIELHAWINPYRITEKASADPKNDLDSLAPNNPAVLHPDWVVKYSDGNLYFDPGLPEVRKLIIDGVLEIIENYNVDGIHFDDYFYPGKDFNDAATYKKFYDGYTNIDDWRRENVNTLIRDLSGAIRSTGKNVRFGISPFGIWANKKKNSLGSDTNGMETFYDQYADTRKWVKEGLVDYIAPQLYGHIGYSLMDYSKLLSWWRDTVKDTGVDLYIGQAAYREGNPDPSSPWYGVSEIDRQLKLNTKTPGIDGSIFFNYKSLSDNPALSALIKSIFEQRDGIPVSIPVSVSRPLEDIRTSFESFYLSGASDPGKPLYLNGDIVNNRSAQGYFGVLVPLKNGANIFTFSQEASYVTRVIYRNTSVPQKMSTAEIPKYSVFPQTQEYRMPGEKITLSCQAPVGAKVKVKINGKSYEMKPSTTATQGTGLYPATYTYNYTLPSYTGTPRNISLGAPVYSMTYKGKTRTCSAPAKIGAIMKGSPFYARVAKDVIDTYQAPVSGNGAAFELYKGMVDYITGMTCGYIRLSCGQWVKSGSVETYTSKTKFNPLIKKAVYKTGEKWDTLEVNLSSSAVSTAVFDGSSLKLNISNASSAVAPELPEGSLFSQTAVSKNGSGIQYILKLKENQRIDGYYIDNSSSAIKLQIKRHIMSIDEDKPLSGMTIVVDPGHGGSETGAIGPLGLNCPEKNINLKTALKLQEELESFGAKVVMTRTDDKTLSLEERLAISRKTKPDMFISMHANAMEDNVDMSVIDGLSVHYREAYVKPLAETMHNNLTNDLTRKPNGIRVNNFYVIRGTWTPSILIESGFVTNPNEFEWLTDENAQSQIAKSISDAVVKYFAE